MLILQEWRLLAFFPVVSHVAACLEVGRSDGASVFGWQLSGLQKSESASSLVSHIASVASLSTRSFANVFIRVYKAECCQGNVSGAALRARACGWITS